MGKNGKKWVKKACQKRDFAKRENMAIHGQRLLLHFLVQFFPIVAPSSLLPFPSPSKSKSNALQLVFKDPAQGFLTSLLSADQSRTLDFELEPPANASKFVEDPLPVLLKRGSGEAVPFTREQRRLPYDATQPASKDSTSTFLFHRPFSGICPVLRSLIPRCQLTSQAFLNNLNLT